MQRIINTKLLLKYRDIMEIEALGGCPTSILPGKEISILATTHFEFELKFNINRKIN